MRNLNTRFDIEALRGFSVLAVMLFHAGLAPAGSGFIGVDVFFAISGYLIIGLLDREYERDGRIMLAEFWGRRARRLLPASTLVVGVTAVMSLFLVNRLTAVDVRLDLAAAALYAANIRFGVTGSDYWATEYISPALHFWSLGVEEQFYIAIPLLMLLAHLVFWKVPSKHMPNVIRAILLLSAVASLWYCLRLVETDPVWGYYSTGGRAWEFAIGGLAALVRTPKLLTTRVLRWPLLLALWAVLAGSAMFIDPKSGYPGLTTVVPVVAAAVVMWLGAGSSTVSMAVFNSRFPALTRLAAWLGGISYSAYLWHWPLLWAAAVLTYKQGGPTEVEWFVAVPVLALTLVFAQLTKKYVEDPIRFRPEFVRSSLRSLRLGWSSSATAVGLVGATTLLPNLYILPAQGNNSLAPEPTPSANRTVPPEWLTSETGWLNRLIRDLVPPVDPEANLRVSALDLELVRGDLPEVDEDGCHAERPDREPTQRCTYGDPNGKEVVALFGDSHAAHYIGGLDAAAKAWEIKVLPRTRASCPSANVTAYLPENREPYEQCDIWRASVVKELRKAKVDLVIISNQRPQFVFDRDTGEMITDTLRVQREYRAGMRATIRMLTEVGIRVLVLRDVPKWDEDLPECLAKAERPADCAQRTSTMLGPTDDDLKTVRNFPNATAIDLTTAICGEQNCYPIRGGTVLARDRAHLTRTYSHLLGPLWEALLMHELRQPR